MSRRGIVSSIRSDADNNRTVLTIANFMGKDGQFEMAVLGCGVDGPASFPIQDYLKKCPGIYANH